MIPLILYPFFNIIGVSLEVMMSLHGLLIYAIIPRFSNSLISAYSFSVIYSLYKTYKKDKEPGSPARREQSETRV